MITYSFYLKSEGQACEKMKVCVTLVEENDRNEFNLPDDALISDLKRAVEESEGVPNERISLYFKTASGHEIGAFKLIPFPLKY